MTEPAAGPVPWRTGTVASQGEDIYFEVTGADAPGAPVVLTHGAGGSHAVWYRQVAALATERPVVTWDTRGFGNSTYRTGVHGAAAAAADLAAVLDAALGPGGTAHLVGQSMGGWWVVEFALAHPARARSLTLANTIASCYTPGLRAHFEGVVRDGAAAAPPAVLGVHPALGDGLARRDPAAAFLYQQLNTFHAPPMLDVAVALLQTEHTHAEVRALGLPILVVTGRDDPLFPAPLVAESGALLGARVVEIDGAGHSPYFERPDEWTAAVARFLRACDGA